MHRSVGASQPAVSYVGKKPIVMVEPPIKSSEATKVDWSSRPGA
jgi:hypothetical protein